MAIVGLFGICFANAYLDEEESIYSDGRDELMDRKMMISCVWRELSTAKAEVP